MSQTIYVLIHHDGESVHEWPCTTVLGVFDDMAKATKARDKRPDIAGHCVIEERVLNSTEYMLPRGQKVGPIHYVTVKKGRNGKIPTKPSDAKTETGPRHPTEHQVYTWGGGVYATAVSPISIEHAIEAAWKALNEPND